MAKVPKKQVLKALSDPHLRAIGLVAAQWASLEISILWVLSKESSLSLTQTVVLAGSQNASAWCEMLRKLTDPERVPGKPKAKTDLDPITGEITALLTLRNSIVHTSWNTPESVGGLLNYVEAKTARPRAAHKAEGIGIPKRGNKIFSVTMFTTSEMLAIATRIQKVEQSLYSWEFQRQKIRQQKEKILARARPLGGLVNLGFGER